MASSATRKKYGYRISWAKSSSSKTEVDEAIAMALRDLQKLAERNPGLLYDVRRGRGRKTKAVEFRSPEDLLTGRVNLVSVALAPLGGELAATRPKPPSVTAAAKYVDDRESGGTKPGADATYYSLQDTCDSVDDARRKIGVVRASPLVHSWRRNGAWIEVVAKVPVSTIAGFKL